MGELCSTVVRGPFLPRKLCSLLDSSSSGLHPSISVISPLMCFLHLFCFPLPMSLIVFPLYLLYFSSSAMAASRQPPRPSSFLSRCLALSDIQYLFHLLTFFSLLITLFLFPLFSPFPTQELTYHLLLIDPNYSVWLLILATPGCGIWSPEKAQENWLEEGYI